MGFGRTTVASKLKRLKISRKALRDGEFMPCGTCGSRAKKLCERCERDIADAVARVRGLPIQAVLFSPPYPKRGSKLK